MDKKEILLKLACAALQGGQSMDGVCVACTEDDGDLLYLATMLDTGEMFIEEDEEILVERPSITEY